VNGQRSALLRSDGSQRLVGVSRQVWEFEVSGYQVLWRWLEHRRGQQMDIEFYRGLQDVAARIAELCVLMAHAADIWTKALERPLTTSEMLPSTVAANLINSP
jgi:hypothetical protein